MYPDEIFDGNTNSIRSIIYRFSNVFMKHSGQTERLIIREGGGYRRNPKLRVVTDMEKFDDHLQAAKKTSDIISTLGKEKDNH